MTWRTGTKNPHTLYEDDEPVGFVIDPLDGARIASAMNAPREAKAEHRAIKAKLLQAEEALSEYFDSAEPRSSVVVLRTLKSIFGV